MVNQIEELSEIDIQYNEEEEVEVDSLSIRSEEIPKEERNLRTQAYDKSVSDLVRMIRDEDIILNTDYQRNYIWDNKKASLLVESILLNIPIPVIYASEEEDNTWNIVDGLQRLSSLRRFFDNNFKLKGLEVLQELNDHRYEDLNPRVKRILNNGIIRIILIFSDSHPEIKYDIFMRLNTGSVRLKEQELRNCLYRGKLNSLLKELRKDKRFLSIIGLKEPHKRMDDAELILRYFAFLENYDTKTGKLNNYKGKIKSFLNNYMSKQKTMDDRKVEYLKAKFSNTLEKVYIVFDNKAFRKIDEYGNFDLSINRAIMDCIMISFDQFSLEEVEGKKSEIIELLKVLPIEDSEFEESITTGTSDTKRIEYRISKWNSELKRVMGE